MPIHSEFFWSKASAQQAANNLQRKHGGIYRTSVRHAMRADMSHDWLLEVFAA